jgi:hypothetical protein
MADPTPPPTSGNQPANERRVRAGGLMRCCLATLAASAAITSAGSVMQCAYSEDRSHSMRVAADGVWEWNRD